MSSVPCDRQRDKILEESKDNLAKMLAPFGKHAVRALEAPRCEAALSRYVDTLLATLMAAKAFAGDTSASNAQALSDAALAFRDAQPALRAEGDEIIRQIQRGELH